MEKICPIIQFEVSRLGQGVQMPTSKRNYCIFNERRVNEIMSQAQHALPVVDIFLKNARVKKCNIEHIKKQFISLQSFIKLSTNKGIFMEIKSVKNIHLANFTQNKIAKEENKQEQTANKEYNPASYPKNYYLSFEGRVDKGLERFYQQNKEYMPQTVKDYIENLTEDEIKNTTPNPK